MIKKESIMVHARNQNKVERALSIHHIINLDILPSRHVPSVIQSDSREPKTLVNITIGHSRILNGGKHLPAVIFRWTSHETSRAEGVMSPGFIGRVVEWTEQGSLRDVG